MTAGGGKYRRDDDGTWRYVSTGEPVPGASDMTLSNLHNLRVIRFGDGQYVEVPRALAFRDPDLRWALDFAPPLPDDLAAVVTPEDPDTGRAVVRVPIAEWDARDRVVGLWAPELAPNRREGVR